MKNIFLSLFVILCFACSTNNDEIITEPNTVTVRVDLSNIEFSDRQIGGRAANAVSPFDYLYFQVVHTGYPSNGYAASGVFAYDSIPAYVEVPLIENDDYKFTYMTLSKGTGYGLPVNAANQLNIQNPGGVIPTWFNTYTSSDSISTHQHKIFPELDIYYDAVDIVADSNIEDSLYIGHLPNLLRTTFAIEVDVASSVDGFIKVKLSESDFEEVASLSFPQDSSDLRLLHYSGFKLYDSELFGIEVIHLDTTQTIETLLYYNSSMMFTRDYIKRIEIDVPSINAPDTLNGVLNWLNFSEVPLNRGDTIRVN